MKIFVAVVIIVVGLIVVLIFSALDIHIRYSRRLEDDEIQLTFKLWKIVRYRYSVPTVNVENLWQGVTAEESRSASVKDKNVSEQKKRRQFTLEEVRQKYRTSVMMIRRVKNFTLIARRFMQRVQVIRLTWHTGLGVKDAADTAVLVGTAYALKSMFAETLNRLFLLRSVPDIRVVPRYNEKIWDTEFRCIVRFRIGHAILAGIRIWMNTKKGREEIWQSTPFKV